MGLQANPCEGTDGTTVTTANSDDNGGNAFALVNIGAAAVMAYETTGAIHGTSSIRMTTPTTTSTVQVGWTDTGATSAVARWYWNFTTLPTAQLQLGVNFRGNSGGTSLARVDTNTDGTFRVVMGASNGSNSASALSTGTTYRMEAVATGFNGSSGTITVTAYVGESTSAFTSATVSGATTAFTADTVRFGKFANTGNFDALFDSLAANIGSSTPLGGAVQTGAVTDTITAGSTVSGVVGAVGAVTQAVTAGSTVSGVVGKVGAVAATITAGATVSGTVAATGAVTSTVTAGSSVAGVVGAVAGVTQTITAGSTVVAVVGVVGSVDATITAGADVAAEIGAVNPTTRGQAAARERTTATGADRARTTATGAARERAVATASGR